MHIIPVKVSFNGFAILFKTLSAHCDEVVILTKFHKDCKKIVDFLLTQKFLVCALFYASPFKNTFFREKLEKQQKTFSIVSSQIKHYNKILFLSYDDDLSARVFLDL